MVKKLTLSSLWLACGLVAAVAQVKVTAQAPQQAEVGRRMQVSYTVDTQDVDEHDIGEFTGFEVLFGPSTSQRSSYTMVNGKATSSSTVTYTYTLMPRKEGTHKLPAMSVTSGGKKYTSNQVSVEVLPGDPSAGQGSSGRSTRTRDAGDEIGPKDLFVTVTASKHRVHEQESVLLTYKLYTLVSIDQCSGKMPELDGFHVREIPLPSQKSLRYEPHNGRNYGTVVWSQYVLFPQKTGRLTVPALSFDVEVVRQEHNVDPFDVFFGGGAMLIRSTKRITAPAVNLEVSALPKRPADFSGAVGQDFTVHATLTPQQVDANDAAQLRVEVKGTGNLQLMTAPTVDWPKDFEVYDPKVTEKTKLTTAGLTGSMVYNYTVVPRHGGRFSVPPVEFTYFDTKTGRYQTVRSDSFQLAVANTASPGTARRVAREDVKVLNSDIRHIMTGSRGIHQQGSRFFASAAYVLVYPCGLLLFLLVAFFLYRRGKADGTLKRGKRAGKAAAKRLKTAQKLMKGNQRGAFYDEVMRALWGYIADKLFLPVAELNKENVKQLLEERGVKDSHIERLMDVLADCEFARFAPSNAAHPMQMTMDDATDVINKLDATL